jgi:AcrR family transcriptional regulator
VAASKPDREGPGIRRGGAQYERIHAQLAKAALVELAENGYADFSVDAAAERAGVAVRTAYRHYETKRDLALAAISNMPDYTGWLDGEDSCEQRLRRGIEIGTAHRQYFVPLLSTCLAHRRSEPILLRMFRSRVLIPRAEALRTFISEGIASGELRADLDVTAIHALEVGLLVAIAAGTLQAGRGQHRADTLFDLIWPMIAS